MQLLKMDGMAIQKKYTMKKDGGKMEMREDIKEDKKLIKKAFKQHDEAEHDKEPTEIKLRHGGRAKKKEGTVKKYKDGGGVYGAKKTKEDLKSIEEAKEMKPKMLKEGGKPKKMATGGSDVEKEKSKPAGHKDPIKKVKPTGDKKAEAPSKASKRPAIRASDVEKEKFKPAGDKVKMVMPHLAMGGMPNPNPGFVSNMAPAPGAMGMNPSMTPGMNPGMNMGGGVNDIC